MKHSSVNKDEYNDEYKVDYKVEYNCSTTSWCIIAVSITSGTCIMKSHIIVEFCVLLIWLIIQIICNIMILQQPTLYWTEMHYAYTVCAKENVFK